MFFNTFHSRHDGNLQLENMCLPNTNKALNFSHKINVKSLELAVPFIFSSMKLAIPLIVLELKQHIALHKFGFVSTSSVCKKIIDANTITNTITNTNTNTNTDESYYDIVTQNSF